MSTGGKGRLVLYGVIAALTAVLMVLAVALWRTQQADRDAGDKADRLAAVLAELGAPVPEREQIVRLLGNDGGPICTDPAGAAQRSASLAAGTKLAESQLAVVAIYCPEQLSAFEESVSAEGTWS